MLPCAHLPSSRYSTKSRMMGESEHHLTPILTRSGTGYCAPLWGWSISNVLVKRHWPDSSLRLLITKQSVICEHCKLQLSFLPDSTPNTTELSEVMESPTSVQGHVTLEGILTVRTLIIPDHWDSTLKLNSRLLQRILGSRLKQVENGEN
jgi:hypothetical protein